MQWYIHPHLVPITVCKGADPYPAYPDHIFSDPGWQKVGSGIRDKHPGSPTLYSLASDAFLQFSPNF